MNDENNVIFHEEQKFSLWIRLPLVCLGVFMIWLCMFTLRDIASERGSVGMLLTAFFVICMVILPAGIAVLFLILKLETQVRTDGLYVRFFPIHIRFKRFSPDDLSEFYTRTYHPILEYGGWGIRYGFGKTGKAYNVRGNKGVQLVLKNGKKLLIGSQRPEQLAQAISSIVQNP